MNPQIATFLFTLGIIGLFVLDRDRNARTSKALWIPVIWLALAGSRNLGEWLALSAPEGDQYVEGSPLDRNVLTGLLVLGIIVLLRRRRTISFLRANVPILLYFFYCGVSVLWSDYPDVSFKRWVRTLGDLVIVLVVLTDPDWLAALKRLLTRVGFLLLPLSVLFIKYYPHLGRSFNPHGGQFSWTGVCTGKNTLGMICLIFGLASAWRILEIYGGKKNTRRSGPLIAHWIVLLTALWLLWEANSVTSNACFLLAGFVMAVLMHWPRLARKPAVVHMLVATVVLGAFCVLFLGIGSDLLKSAGRDSTLTGRYDIWHLAIGLDTNPLLGTGYESFWLGPRLEAVRKIYPNHVNQVHNGYLEVFLNVGWVGVTLLAVVIFTGYRRIVAAVVRRSVATDLCLAYFVVAVIYNFTEGGFKMMYPIWIFFLLATIAGSKLSSLKPRVSASIAPPTRFWADQPVVSTHMLEEV
jgi:exopolysaccharide production protein ExoQ